MKQVLITGASGMVGRKLVRRFLTDTDDFLHLLVHRGGRGLDATSFVREVVEMEPVAGCDRRVTLLAGDCAAKGLGLPADSLDRVRREVTHVVHAASTTRFDLPLAKAREINVNGVAHALDVASSCDRLEQFAFVSTAYVCGRRTGVIREHERAHGEGFVNTYEKSKYEAEELVESASRTVPAVVFRLSTVLGDSRGGGVANFTAPHQALKIIHLGLASMLPGEPGYRVDLVPGDYVTDAMFRLLDGGARPGDVFHLTGVAERSFTLAEIVDAAYESFAALDPTWGERRYPKPVIAALDAFDLFMKSVKQANNPMLTAVLGALQHFAGQLAYPKEFDRTRVLECLPDYDRSMPDVRDYFRSVIDYCLKTQWGRHVHGARARVD